MSDTVISDVSHDHGYDRFLSVIRETFEQNEGGQVFTTDALGLWEAFLSGLPEEHRQHYTCHSCRRFVEGFGGLVRINEDGTMISAIWPNSVPDFFVSSVGSILKIVLKARVTGVFLDTRTTWGEPVTGEWCHMAVNLSRPLMRPSALKTAFQAMAEKKEEFGMLCRGLAAYGAETVTQALRVLESDTLYRSEKVLGPATFLRDLHAVRASTKNTRAKENMTWLAVAKAPAGFCHVQSSMIGTLLDDIAAGMGFEDIKRRFADKMHPLRYQRPEAAPSAGNIAQAEKIIADLGATSALRRRFARLDEVKALWMPKALTEDKPEGVFGHLKPKGEEAPALDIPSVKMTWEKFAKEVLPEALKLELLVSRGTSNFAALTTAVDPDALPILQWDSPEARNPVCWYLYSGGSMASNWGLRSGEWANVDAVTLKPSFWGEAMNNQSPGAVLILHGAKDSREVPVCIFPETLKSDFHAIRATIEAFSRNGKMEGADESSACGLMVEGQDFDHTVRVTTKLGRQSYRLDRWN